MNRKLTEAELNLFASAFAITNHGIAVRVPKPGTFALAEHAKAKPFVEVPVPATPEEYERAGSRIRQWGLNMLSDINEDAAERAIAGEYKSWQKSLKKETLESIGKIWTDMRDVCRAMAK